MAEMGFIEQGASLIRDGANNALDAGKSALDNSVGALFGNEGEGSFTQKEIKITIVKDAQGQALTYEFQGFATTVTVSKTGTPSKPKATVTIKGMALNTMAELTQLAFQKHSLRLNKIKIEAGQKGKALSCIFTGEITSAWANFNSAPTVEFNIDARSGSYPSLKPQSPMTIKGSQSASDAIKSLCEQIGYTLENNAVTASIRDCIIKGDPVAKIKQIASMVGCEFLFDDDQVVLIPKGQTRKDRGQIPYICGTNGMIGYPTFDDNGINVVCYFRPELRIGAKVKVGSMVPRASGIWKIVSLTHSLSANDPSGSDWQTVFKATYLSES